MECGDSPHSKGSLRASPLLSTTPALSAPPLLIQEGRRLAPGGGYSGAPSARVVTCGGAFFRSL
jgi:hypothetical protein